MTIDSFDNQQRICPGRPQNLKALRLSDLELSHIHAGHDLRCLTRVQDAVAEVEKLDSDRLTKHAPAW